MTLIFNLALVVEGPKPAPAVDSQGDDGEAASPDFQTVASSPG